MDRPDRTRRTPRRRRNLTIAACVLAAIVVVGPSVYAASVALSPYTSVAVPSSCTTSVSHLPADRGYAIPGQDRSGTLLAATATSAVVLVADYGHTPFGSTVDVVDRSRSAVVRSMRFPDDIVAVAIDQDVAYVYDNKLLYLINVTTGQPVQGIVRFDNYRGLYDSGEQRRMQTSAAISSVGFDGHLMVPLDVHFTTVAFGCYFP